MLGAHPEYGAFVNPSKTLVNFDTSVGGVKINRPVDIDEFPYCGILLNTRNLDISKDTTKLIRAGMDWLTKVEYSKMPQQALRRKARQALQMQSHRMYFETEYNNFTTVLKNLYHNFTQAAHKVYYGAKVLKGPNSPDSQLLIEIIEDLLRLQYTIIKTYSKHRHGPRCSVSKYQVFRLRAHAFRRVLRRIQTGYGGVLKWLNDELREGGGGSDRALESVLKQCEASESVFVVIS